MLKTDFHNFFKYREVKEGVIVRNGVPGENNGVRIYKTYMHHWVWILKILLLLSKQGCPYINIAQVHEDRVAKSMADMFLLRSYMISGEHDARSMRWFGDSLSDHLTNVLANFFFFLVGLDFSSQSWPTWPRPGSWGPQQGCEGSSERKPLFAFLMLKSTRKTGLEGPAGGQFRGCSKKDWKPLDR